MNLLENMKKSKVKIIKDETMTGGGSGGATFTAGAGDQYATNRMFKKKKIKEEVSYTPEKREELYQKYLKEFEKNKSDLERLTNIFKGFSIEELLQDTSKAEKIIKAANEIHEKYNKASNELDDIKYMYGEDGMKEEEDKASELENSYYKLSRASYEIYDVLGDIVEMMKKIKEKSDK